RDVQPLERAGQVSWGVRPQEVAMLPLRFVLVVGALASAGAFSFAGPPCEIETKGAIALRMERKQTVFVITSGRGIGDATMWLKSGQWPSDVILRFQYKEGSGFEMLESLGVTTDRFQISWAPSRDKEGLHKWGEQMMGFYLADAEGKFVKKGRATGYFLGKVEKTKRGVEVRLPANVFTGSKEVKIGWVDAFRR